ncbi:hypothetical protein [Rhodococcus sp. HNM0569]|uniref:hypothetical protein n=1 Tax=Rhodococcus sp. HNM0569 TaxID=2716340 RepID=UPI00146E955A|nr:hypothetical protein [Rhodococcus sp. HNM0569]NLU85137.1 hypothetical protein [Rhodococcus sp. HNM0569]
MSTPNPRPGVPLPGPPPTVDPEQIRADVGDILARLDGVEEHVAGSADTDVAGVLAAKARLLDEAHERLTDALSTLDKI